MADTQHPKGLTPRPADQADYLDKVVRYPRPMKLKALDAKKGEIDITLPADDGTPGGPSAH